MEKSESIAKLSAALLAAQKEFPPMDKDKTATIQPRDQSKSPYKYQYADLFQIVTKIVPVLEKNGLVFIQPTITSNGNVLVETVLMHESGEWLSGTYPVSPMAAKQKDMGGNLTYARRYALCAMLGIVADEDLDARGNMPSAKGAEDANAPPARVDGMRKAFTRIGANDDQIEAIMGVPFELATTEDIDRMLEIYQQIKAGTHPIETFLPPEMGGPPAPDDGPTTGTAQSLLHPEPGK